MATKNTTKTRTPRAYGPRKPRYALVISVEGTLFVSADSWTDREYADFRATTIEGATVMQRGAAPK